jgi:hypothetical protein
MPLTTQDEALVEPFLKNESPASGVDGPIEEQVPSNQGLSYSVELERKLKRQRMETLQAEKPKAYIDLNVMPGTSVNCERLFSAAKFILSDTRKRTSPTLFEALLLLKVNRKYWNTLSVGKAMGKCGESCENIISDDDGLDMQSDCLYE